MSDTEWKDTLLQSLEQRDEREQVAPEVYEAYLRLATSYATLRAEGSPGLSPAPVTPTNTDGNEASSLKAQVTELYKAQNTHLQKITALEAEVSTLQQTEKQLQQELTALRARRKDLELRAALHDETIREKNKQVQLLQDELLTTGITLTVLEEKTAELKKENKSLLERWMTRISAEAEKMNDANEFLEQIRGMRLSSPVTSESPEKRDDL